MHTIQVSLAEVIQAVYEEMIEQYGDRELALIAAQAIGDDLLASASRATAQTNDADH